MSPSAWNVVHTLPAALISPPTSNPVIEVVLSIFPAAYIDR